MTLAEQYALLNNLKDKPLFEYNMTELPTTTTAGNYLKTVNPENFYQKSVTQKVNPFNESFISNPVLQNTRGQTKSFPSLTTNSVNSAATESSKGLSSLGASFKNLGNSFGWDKNSGLTAFGKN